MKRRKGRFWAGFGVFFGVFIHADCSGLVFSFRRASNSSSSMCNSREMLDNETTSGRTVEEGEEDKKKGHKFKQKK